MNISLKRTLGASLVLTAFSLESMPFALAQSCAVAPTCESLGYTKTTTDCKGLDMLKCPLDTTKVFCTSGSNFIPCTIGSIFNEDGSCTKDIVEGKNALGIVVASNLIINFDDANISYSDAENLCSKLGQDWFIPTRDQWKKITESIEKINLSLDNQGKETLQSAFYWAEEYICSYPCYIGGEWITCSGSGCAHRVNPITGSTSSGIEDNYGTLYTFRTRCIKSI